jgi:hypothetical protein
MFLHTKKSNTLKILSFYEYIGKIGRLSRLMEN